MWQHLTLRRRLTTSLFGFFRQSFPGYDSKSKDTSLIYDNVKSPNILLFSDGLNVEAFDQIKCKLYDCFKKNVYDIQHINNTIDFFNAPWEENIQALIIYWKQCKDVEVIQEIKERLDKYLNNGGTVLIFGEVFADAYFKDLMTECTELVDIKCCIKDDIFRFPSNEQSIKRVFRDHKNGILRLYQNKNIRFLGTKLFLPTTNGYLLACLLPLLKIDALKISENKEEKSSYVLSQLLSNVGLLCESEKKSKFVDQLKDVYTGFLYSSPKDRLIFQNCIERCNKPQLIIINSKDFQDSDKFVSLCANHHNIIVSSKDNDLKSSFNWNDFCNNLSSKSFGRCLVHYDIISSTMDVLLGVDYNLPDDLSIVVTASQQDKGKGRGSNKWLSPLGCAMFTLTTSIGRDTRLGNRLSLIQHFMAVSVVHAIRSIPGLENMNVGVKWPNDIYFGKTTKLGGVIVQSSFFRNNFIVRIGCGINVSNDKPSSSINTILKDHFSMDLEVSCEEVIAKSLSVLESLISDYQSFGPNYFLQLYYKYWIHKDARVTFYRNQIEYIGKVSGIDDVGYLVVVDQLTGEKISLHPDGNSFDIMKNLIYPKTR